RSAHGRLIRRAAEAGAKVIAFDLVFEQDSADPVADADLAQAVEFANARSPATRVIFGVKMLRENRPGEERPPGLASALGRQEWGSVGVSNRSGLYGVPLALISDPGGSSESSFMARTPALALVSATGTRLELCRVQVEHRLLECGPWQTRFSAVERMDVRAEG